MPPNQPKIKRIKIRLGNKMKRYQISKIKDQIYKSKIKNIKIFDVLYVFFIFNVLYLISGAVSIFAVPTYPIPELGNCRNSQECYYYCQIPQNTPTCWSYNKYIISKDVLGEEAISPEEEAKRLGITFPVPELGNCNSPSECFVYCNQPQNQAACFAWAKKKGLVKQPNVEENIMAAAIKELGCKSELECMVFCQQPDNMNKCQEFAGRHSLVKEEHRDDKHQGPSPAIMAKARAELGCDNEESCMKFCNKGDNMSKCMEFAKRHGMMEEEEYEKHKGYMEKKGQMMEDAKKELGCVSREACASFCSNPQNMDKCMGLARKYGMGGANPSGRYIQYDQTGKNILPCSSPVECQELCAKNINICAGGIPPQSVPRQSRESPQFQQSGKYDGGDSLGPAGCKTEAECKAYCQNNPETCPGFPKRMDQKPPEYINPEIKVSPIVYPTDYTPRYTPPPYPTYQPPPQYEQSTSYPTHYPTYSPQPTYTQTYPTISP